MLRHAVILLVAAAFTHAAPSAQLSLYGIHDAVSATAAVDAALASTSYTYVIVGGGTAGLALAARLSERSSVTVAVLEAGGDESTNPLVTVPGNFGAVLGTEADWGYLTTPQEHLGNRPIYLPRGKVLGGCSTVNLMAWTKGNKEEYDAFESLGATGWNWNSLQSSAKKAEQFHPAPQGPRANYTHESSAHGFDGPVDTSFPPWAPTHWEGFTSALRGLGVAKNEDVTDGSNHGFGYAPVTVKPNGFVRETSQTAYITPILASRRNFLILTHAHAGKIVWGADKGGKAKAAGVTFFAGGSGAPKTVRASREVILAAGTVQSPQLLEVSGVGDPQVLQPLGVSVKVPLPGVGSNLQDHTMHLLNFKLKPGYRSMDDVVFNATYGAEVQAQYEQGTGPLTHVFSALAYLKAADFLTAADRVHVQRLLATTPSSLPREHLELHRSFVQSATLIEPILAARFYTTGAGVAEPGVSYVGVGSALQHPLSRGSIHISSADPLARPVVNPSYLSHPADVFLVAKSLAYIRKLAQRPEFSKYIAAEAEPGAAVQTHEDWEAYARTNLATEDHILGTCAMMPRLKKGVVDPTLTVYGTSNVRVVDLSVVPIHVSTHPVSLVYAIAERASSIILS